MADHLHPPQTDRSRELTPFMAAFTLGALVIGASQEPVTPDQRETMLTQAANFADLATVYLHEATLPLGTANMLRRYIEEIPGQQ